MPGRILTGSPGQCGSSFDIRFALTDEFGKAAKAGTLEFRPSFRVSGSVEVELNDLDGVGRKSEREVAAHVVQGRLDGNYASGVVDGVGGLRIGCAETNEFRISRRMGAGEREPNRLWVG